MAAEQRVALGIRTRGICAMPRNFCEVEFIGNSWIMRCEKPVNLAPAAAEKSSSSYRLIRGLLARFSYPTSALREPFQLGENVVHVGVSIGTTLYPEHARDASSLMRNADLAMYAAKNCGKNHNRFFSKEMQATLESRHRMQTRLRQALENDALTLDYQPIVRTTDSCPLGCEALARWRPPDDGEIPPSQFIPLAEQTGLITSLGARVFQQACRQTLHWQEMGMLKSRIAVNLSPRQLRDPRLVERVSRLAGRVGGTT